MTSAKSRHPNADAPVLWHAVIWIIAVHLLGALGIWYLWAHFLAATVVLALGMFVLVHLSISAGLHRLYSHKAYRATKPLEIFLVGLTEGAGARDGEDHRDEAKSGKARANRAEAAANQSRLPPREDHRTI
jgi:fatty-acid desaturase